MNTKILLSAVIVTALFTRSFQYRDRFYYNHDNDLASWIVKDIVVDGHPRLIGQLTSAPGIFIGPAWYWSLVPAYLAAGMNPLGGVWLSVGVGLISVLSVWYVFSRLHTRRTGWIAAAVYAVSFGIVATEREVVPTTPVFLWTIWFYYSVFRLFSGDKRHLYIMAVLFSLVWHIHLALGLLVPLAAIAVWRHVRRYRVTDLIGPALVFILLSTPLFLFEIRHDFGQLRALLSSLSSVGSTPDSSAAARTSHVLEYSVRNANYLYWDRPGLVPGFLLPALLVGGLVWLAWRRLLPGRTLFVFGLWFALQVAFFAFHPINLSEYYLNGLQILWLAAGSLLLSYLLGGSKVFRTFGLAILVLLIGHNLFRLFDFTVNRSGYRDRTDLVSAISRDARSHGYPCVSVSYMTTPGNELGYRYLFWRENLHVNQPGSGSPVYTIVFPHSLAGRLDETFGALGLIHPEYSRYTQEGVADSCSGANSNLTDPMFGFTR